MISRVLTKLLAGVIAVNRKTIMPHETARPQYAAPVQTQRRFA